MASTDSLLSRLSGTFEPAHSILTIEACRGCRSSTLRTPRLSTDNKYWLMSCPACNYLNIEQAVRGQAKVWPL